MDKGKHDHTREDDLLKQVTVLCFMATDLHLYLNTHPEDKEALAMYNDIVEKEQVARRKYEEKHGPLRTGEKARHGWQWICCPWPWQESFNYGDAPHKADWKKPYGEEHL